MIKLNNINKYYNKGKSNELHAVNNTTIELPDNGLISFLGESGSGKSTLLNVIGGLDKATGAITYDNLTLDKYNMHRLDAFRAKSIGYVFQDSNLLNDKTVSENIRLSLELIDIYNKDEQDKRIKAALNAVGLYKMRKKPVVALSGGEQQRVSIARALAKGSKIIIADEPTGSLDSDNAIRVMNILKGISKNSLVVLVTHNENLAYSYSDMIYRISDGVITSAEVGGNESNSSFSDSNKIYLKDIESRSLNKDHDIIYYSDLNSKLSLKIIERNGTFYIDSPMNIVLMKDSRVKLIDAHKEDLRKDTIEDECSFSKEGFNDSIKENFFKVFIKNVKESLKGLFSKSRKLRILYIALIIIGIIFSTATIAYTNFSYVDTNKFDVDPSYSSLSYNDDLDKGQTILSDLVLQNAISDLTQNVEETVSLIIDVNMNIKEKISCSSSFYNSTDGISYASGGKIKGKNECLITTGLADYFVDNSKYISSYSDLIGKRLELYNLYDDVEIVGICTNDRKLVYLDDYSFMALMRRLNNAELRVDRKDIRRIYGYENKVNAYTVAEGRDLTGEKNNDCLVSIDQKRYYPLGEEAKIDNNTYRVVGYYVKNYNDVTYSNEIIVNYLDSFSFRYKHEVKYSELDSSYTLINGREIEASNECLASCYSGLEIGDKANGATVVGIFNGSDTLYQEIIYSRDFVISNFNNYHKKAFKINDLDKVNSITDEDFHPISTLDVKLYDHRRFNKDNLLIFGTISIITAVIAIVFIYIILRARILSEIKEIGIYRALGAKRSRIYKNTLYSSIAIVGITLGLGYLIGIVVYVLMGNIMNGLIGEAIYLNNYLFWFIGYLISLVVGILVAIIPLIGILRKTPAEILTSYDN